MIAENMHQILKSVNSKTILGCKINIYKYMEKSLKEINTLENENKFDNIIKFDSLPKKKSFEEIKEDL